MKIFALETIGSLLDVVNDKDEEQKILQSFFVHYKGLKREAAELGSNQTNDTEGDENSRLSLIEQNLV